MSKRVVHTSARSLERCRKLGWIADKCERWVPMASHPGGGIRKDLFGWCDLIVLRPVPFQFIDEDGAAWPAERMECVGVQACNMSTRAAHLEKLADAEIADRIRRWLLVEGHRAELWAFRKLKAKRGGKAVRWECEVTPLGVS